MIRRHHVLSHGPARELAVHVGASAIVAVSGASDTDYTNAGLPIPPKDSTGNDKSDQMRKDVWAGGLAAAKACPACAPYIAVGLVVFEGWIRVGAFLSGESKDDDKYQSQAKDGINMFLVRGFVPRKWVTEVEFAADYAHYLGTQINALTLYPSGNTFPAELNTDFGLTIMELIKTPAVHDRVAKGNASPFSGMVPDPGWRYGIYDSYPDANLIGLVAAARHGKDVASMQAEAQSLLSTIRSHGVVVPTNWPTDPKDQAYASAAATAAIWNAIGGKSRGFYLSASGAPVDPSTGGLYKGSMNTPLEVMTKAPWVKAVSLDLVDPKDRPMFFTSWWSKTLLVATSAFLGWKYWPHLRGLLP